MTREKLDKLVASSNITFQQLRRVTLFGMDICLTCGQEYDPIQDPDHEETCMERLAEQQMARVKPIPELTSILEGLIEDECTHEISSPTGNCAACGKKTYEDLG